MKWLRLFVGVLLAAALLLALAVLVLLWPLREWSTDLARQQVERALAAGLEAEVSIGALRVSFLPPRVEADNVALGTDGALARAAHVTVRLLPRVSLQGVRPVGEATVDDVFVDVPAWVALIDSHEPTPPQPVPSFLLRNVVVNRARVRIASDDTPIEVTAPGVTGELASDMFGRLQFVADAQEPVFSLEGRTLVLQHAHGRGGETADGGWRLSEAEVVGDGVDLASAPASGDQLPVRGRIALRRLSFADPLFERLEGEAEVDVAVIGRLEEPSVTGSLRVPDFAADGERIGNLSASAAWDLQKLTISAARLENGDGSADASGELSMDAPFAYRAQLRWRGIDLPRLARLPPHAIKQFAANGEATLAGGLKPLSVRAEGRGQMVASAGGQPIDWSGQADFRDGVGSGTIDARQGSANSVRGNLEIRARGALQGSFEAAVSDAGALSAFLPIESVPNLSGALTASAQITGSTADPHLNGQLAGRNVVVLGVGVQKLGGDFALDRAALRTAGITAELWQGSITLVGTIALDGATSNDFQLRAVDVPGEAAVGVVYGLTGTLPPIGRGTLAGQVTARGPWQRVQFTGNAEMLNFWLGRQWIVRAAVDGNALWPSWQLAGELRNRADQTLELRGRGTGTGDVAIEAHSAGWQLTALQRGELTQTGGTLLLDASVSGPLSALNGRATLQGRDLVVGGRQIGAADVEAVATRGRWDATAVVLGGAVQVRGTLAPQAGWPVTVNAEWTEADFGSLLVPDSDVHATSTGTAQLSTRLSALQQFDATVQVGTLRIVNGPYEISTVQGATLECRRGACTLREVQLRGLETDLRVAGTLGTSGAVQLTLRGEGDLRLLEMTGTGIESARGRFSVDADVHRTGGRWDVGGQIRVEQAALDVGAPVAITRATGRLTLIGTSVQIDQLGGRVGTGTFQVGGQIDLARGPDLVWSLTDVGADLLPSLEAELSGNGSLEGTWERMRLAGEIDIARMLYDRKIELTDFLPALNRALADAPKPETTQLELDLRIVAPGELYVENNVARIEARADLRIGGTAQRPVLDGRIEALDGTVTFRDREFELQGGTVDFRPDLGLAAALNISAESTIDTPDATYTVDVRVTGTTRDPRVTMSSDDPSLSPTDIATLIAVGKTTAQLREGGGGGFSVYDALAAVPGQLSEPVTQGTKKILPIDRISFESTYSRTTGTFEPQLKLGKDLTDNLAVALGQTFGVESRTSVEADYRLTPRIFIPLTWESQTSTQEGAFGAGVKVRYEFWRISPYTLVRWLR